MSLWDEARDQFAQHLREQNEDSQAIEQFFRDKGTIDEARDSAESLRKDSDKKYGSSESRGKGVSAKWIRRIFDNMGKFMAFGDLAFSNAPQSVGLVWFAVKNVLQAVQNDYNLYGIFTSSLSDITEMMVLIRTYEDIHAHTGKTDSVYKELSRAIREVYFSILDFAYAVRKHITASKRGKIAHILKDTVGAMNRAFGAKNAALTAGKGKIIDLAQAAFQKTTSGDLDNISGDLGTIQKNMGLWFEFQQQSALEMKEILSELRPTKAPSHREIAVAEYDANMKLLTPHWEESALDRTLDEREPDTCTWCLALPEYEAWYKPGQSSILCLTGEANSGKSITGGLVYENVRKEEKTIVQYVDQSKFSDDGIEALENTLLRSLYVHALEGDDDDLLLQKCNNIFAHPAKSKDKEKASGSREKDRGHKQERPDFLDLFPALVDLLKKPVYLILDATSALSDEHQSKLAERLLEIQKVCETDIHIFVLCRQWSALFQRLRKEEVPYISTSDHNKHDIELLVQRGVAKIPALSQAERTNIEEAITEKAGHRIRYVQKIALPFLIQTPVRRPISSWLEGLPNDIYATYDQHLRQLSPSLRQLLEVALRWTLTAERAPSVVEIMDDYSGIYDTGEDDIDDGSNLELYESQLLQAGGPFLEVRDKDRVVVLQDTAAIKTFCTETATSTANSKEYVCARCNEGSATRDRIRVSLKHAHLRMATMCLRHFNSPTFRKRFFADILTEATARAERRLQVAQDDPTDQGEEISAEESNAEEKNESGSAGNASGEEQPTDAEMSTNEETTDAEKAEDGAENKGDSDEAGEVEVDDDESTYSDFLEDIEVDTSGTAGNEEVVLFRYEGQSWYYHIQEAEKLWTAEERKQSPEWATLLSEIERFCVSQPVGHEVWKLVWAPYNREGWAPIFLAAQYGLVSMAEFLLDSGAAKITDETPGGFTPLHIGSEADNRLEILDCLFRRGADPNYSDQYWSGFHDYLTMNMDIDSTRLFLKHGASCTKVSPTDGWSAIHYFAQYNSNLDVLQLLLDNPGNEEDRCDINALTESGETPLHLLLNRRNIPMDILKEFLERGAQVNLDDKDSERPLYEAAFYGEYQAVETIIEYVSDIDDDNKWGRTALHVAAWSGKTKLIELLLERGADPNRQDKHKRTALFFACLTHLREATTEEARQETAEKLVEAQIKSGAPFSQICCATKGGRTPLREAAGRGFVKVVSLILEQMIEEEDREMVNFRDHGKGRTPLHSAAAHGRGEVIELLLTHKADATLRDGAQGTGMTPLELCLDRWSSLGTKRFEDAMVRLIGASVEEATQSSQQLLTVAATHGSIPVLQKLADIGVQVDAQDPYGWTAAELATQFGHHQAAALIKKLAQERALKPTSWLQPPELKDATIEEDGVLVTYVGDEHVCVRANHPVPAGFSVYYYETEILEVDEAENAADEEATSEPKVAETDAAQVKEVNKIVALGFCNSQAEHYNFPGWPPKPIAPNAQSFAYHADDGGFFSPRPGRTTMFEPYGPGDVIGCGLDLISHNIFFVKNGVRIENHGFDNVRGRLFPILGLKDVMKLRTNFGERPFKWTPPDWTTVVTEDNEL